MRLSFCFFLLMACSQATSAQVDTLLIKTFGGPNYEKASAVVACTEGGYAVIGTTGSNQTGNTDMFLLRLDDNLIACGT